MVDVGRPRIGVKGELKAKNKYFFINTLDHTEQCFKVARVTRGPLWKVINNVVPSKSQEKHVYSKDLKTVANDFNSDISHLSGAVLLTQLPS